jgi:hypothetical protein
VLSGGYLISRRLDASTEIVHHYREVVKYSSLEQALHVANIIIRIATCTGKPENLQKSRKQKIIGESQGLIKKLRKAREWERSGNLFNQEKLTLQQGS